MSCESESRTGVVKMSRKWELQNGVAKMSREEGGHENKKFGAYVMDIPKGVIN